MSHYAVAVFSRSEDDVEDLLAPFEEGVTPGSQYSEFVEDEEFEMDDLAGKRGYWHNPDAKWDWYSIGGRFADLLQLKNGECADSANARECYFSINDDVYNKAIRFWEVFVEKKPITPGENEADFDSFWKPEYYKDQWESKEDYAKEMAGFGTYAFLSADGEWHEPGRMGWFAVADTNASSKKSYNKVFQEYLEYALKENLLITIVDCHI